jgi:hypothetical protein
MAYVQKTTDEDEQLQGQEGPEKVLSQGTATADNGQAEAPTSGPQQTAPGKAKGSGWTNLVDYVSANRGAGQQMASRVGETIQNQGDQAQQQGQNYQNSAAQTVSAATPKRDQSLIDDVMNDPTKITGQRAQQFQAQRNASYAGPKAAQEIAGYQDVQAAYDKTSKAAQDAGDFEGRRGLLHDAYGKRSDYTAGESRLDSFLTGADGAQQIAEAQQNFGQGSNFQKGWGDLVSSVSGKISEADAAAQATKADTNAALDSAVTGSDRKFAEYSKKADATNAANTAAYQKLDSRLRSEDPKKRAKAFAEIGLDAKTGEWLMSQGYSLPQLVSAGKSMKGGDYASDKDVANAKALYGLKGTNIDPNILAKSGGDGSAYVKNAQAIKGASDAKAMQDAIASRLAAQNAARADEFGMMNHEFISFNGPSDKILNKLGISREDYIVAAENGIDILGYAKAGKKLTAGDVATAKERQGWTNLMTSLGLNPANYDLQDRQDEGDAYSFDRDGFNAAVLATRDRLAAEEAARAAAAAQAGSSGGGGGRGGTDHDYTVQTPYGEVHADNPTPDGKFISSDKRAKKDVKNVDDDEIGSFLKSLGRKNQYG